MLKPEQIASVKGRGFLINRGTECFSGRLVCAGAVFTAADLRTISEIAEKFGSGKVTFTSRLSAEIVGIPFEQIDAACDYAAERGLYFGGTGAKIRPVTACKGTTCVYGNYDTQALAKELHEKYYVGWANVKLPHKFKIGRPSGTGQRKDPYARRLWGRTNLTPSPWGSWPGLRNRWGGS